MTYVCPACGYDRLREPSSNNVLCSSCGFEFGYDDQDQGWSYAQWRRRWIANGMPFENAKSVPPPPGWNPEIQLAGLPQKSDVQEFIDFLLLQNEVLQPIYDRWAARASGPESDQLFFQELAQWMDRTMSADPDGVAAYWPIHFLEQALLADTDEVVTLIVRSFLASLPAGSPVIARLEPELTQALPELEAAEDIAIDS